MKLSLVTNEKTFAAIKKLMVQPMPIKSAFKLKNTVKKLDEHLTSFHEVRKNRLNQLCSKDENGNPLFDDKGGLVISQEDLVVFSKEITELLDQDIEVALLSIEELASCNLSGEDLLALDGFITAD